MSPTAPPPDSGATTESDQPKREYHAPELRDVGSVTELTRNTGSGNTDDGGGLPYFS